MAVGPFDANRVAAHEVHLFDGDRVGDASWVEDPLAGPLVDAMGALTFAPQKHKRKLGVAIGPRDFQQALVAYGLEIERHFAHEITCITLETTEIRSCGEWLVARPDGDYTLVLHVTVHQIVMGMWRNWQTRWI